MEVDKIEVVIVEFVGIFIFELLEKIEKVKEEFNGLVMLFM